MAALAPLFALAIEKTDIIRWLLFWGLGLVAVGISFWVIEWSTTFKSFDREERRMMRDKIFELQAAGVEAGEENSEKPSSDSSDFLASDVSDVSDGFSDSENDSNEKTSEAEEPDSDCSEDSAFYDKNYGKLIKPGGRLDLLMEYVVDCVNLLVDPRFALVAGLKLIEALNFIDPQTSLVSVV